MKVTTCFTMILVCSALLLQQASAAGPIVIGFDLPLTGDLAAVGKSSQMTGQLIHKQLNGVLKVGGQEYELSFIYEDNKTSPSSATRAALHLITREKALGIIGPLSSSQAVPTGGVANSFSTAMISPWSTALDTTLNRPFVFRSCVLDPIQGAALSSFAGDSLAAEKAAVLYDIVTTYPRTLANSFKDTFEKDHGAGSVVAFEEFRAGDKNFSQQLARIVNSGADVLFVPQYYYEIPGIVQQARDAGWSKPIFGADAWAGGDLMAECGELCKGLFFSAHFAPHGVTGKAKEFVELYEKEYGVLPDEVAALTWDSVQVMLLAIQATEGLSGNILEDRKKVKDQIVAIKNYDGVTGTISHKSDGNPDRCVAIIQIGEDGLFSQYKSICQ
ncbi:ABC transporter substrate-binding protein [Desulfogranum japonicum]|uniref:ABC transporter substrate-binding protein n=1 Tax=Desulfogranum japonicum TaxID=231447 RepID=UPI000490E724|nr:ABC transporter substrate-binding protein [Desulfogranum japonicum]